MDDDPSNVAMAPVVGGSLEDQFPVEGPPVRCQRGRECALVPRYEIAIWGLIKRSVKHGMTIDWLDNP